MKSTFAKIGVSSFLFASVLAVPGIASAAEHPVAGCGAGWELNTVEVVKNGKIDWRIYPDNRPEIELLVDGEDMNMDGWLCTKQWKPNRGQDKHWGATDFGFADYVVTGLKDNTTPGRTP